MYVYVPHWKLQHCVHGVAAGLARVIFPQFLKRSERLVSKLSMRELVRPQCQTHSSELTATAVRQTIGSVGQFSVL